MSAGSYRREELWIRFARDLLKRPDLQIPGLCESAAHGADMLLAEWERRWGERYESMADAIECEYESMADAIEREGRSRNLDYMVREAADRALSELKKK